MVAIVQWPLLACQARYLDDNLTVTANALVAKPGWESANRLVREWRSPSVPGYYQPVTMLSLMLDTAWGGRKDDFTAYHRTSLVFHLLNVLLAGLVAFSIFGAAIPAVFTALLFGLHPLVVEPMAWLSERKSLLATFFSWLAMWLYLVNARHRVRRIVLPLVAWALALLAKPSVLALPLMLVVLDVWPLRRAGRAALLEKWPFFAVALASSAITTISQRSAPITPLAHLSLVQLLLEGLYLVGYYGRLPLAPVDLTPLIPPPNPLTFTTPDVLFGVFGTIAVVALFWRLRRRLPAGLAGLVLYGLALAPTFTILTWSSFLAYGRYLYFPAIGLLVVAGGIFAAAWNARSPAVRGVAVAAALLVVALEARGSRAALAPWRDSVALWRHVVELAPDEPTAQNGYAVALEESGDRNAAAAEYRKTIAAFPSYYFARYNLGTLDYDRGDLDESIRVLSDLVSFSPTDDALLALGKSEFKAGRAADAERHLRAADSLRPGRSEILNDLALAQLQQGENLEAIATLRRSAASDPKDAHSRLMLAVALITVNGIRRETLDLLEEAVALAPAWAKPRISLAWLLATAPEASLRDPARARALAEESVRQTGGNDASALDALAAARAGLGDFANAVDAERAARDLATAAHEDSLARAYEGRLTLYRRGQPYVQAKDAR